jgi:hypothetical protein
MDRKKGGVAGLGGRGKGKRTFRNEAYVFGEGGVSHWNGNVLFNRIFAVLLRINSHSNQHIISYNSRTIKKYSNQSQFHSGEKKEGRDKRGGD